MKPKCVYTITMLLPLLLLVACTVDIPTYGNDAVVKVARNYSPECPPPTEPCG